jgi:uncharacterized membrane protein YdcZ (DUF606 family)
MESWRKKRHTKEMATFLLPFLVSLGLGCASVLQGGINRRLIPSFSLPVAVALNALILVVMAATVFFFSAPEKWTRVSQIASDFKPWFLLPGLCGACIVFGIPWSISRWGALNTFVVMIGAQLLVGLTWDSFVEGIPLTTARGVGTALALFGAAVTLFR